MSKYNIIIPAISELMLLCSKIIEFKKDRPEIYRTKLNSIQVYGRFPYSIWSQEPSERKYTYMEDIEQNLKFLKDNNTDIYYEFSNTQLTKESVYDSFCNMELSLSENLTVFAIVYSQYLVKYVKTNYPNVKLIRPQLYDKTIPDEYYDLYIINYEHYTKEKDRILMHPEKYIIYLNSYGPDKKEIADKKSKDILEFNSINYDSYPLEIATFEESKKLADFVAVEIMEKLAFGGIKNFIIKNNRNSYYEILESFIYYLIKPEYQDKIRLELIKIMCTN